MVHVSQQIRFCRGHDGVRIAYATAGRGAPIVKVANWLSHLQYDWASPVWRGLLAELSREHTLVRYDERGCGLSDWNVDDLSFESWVRDLETVVDAAGVDRFALLGLSQGASTSPRNAGRFMREFNEIDVVDYLPRVSCPTLVLHSTRDVRVPFDEGRLMASGIPDARFVPVESNNHLLLDTEPGWHRWREARGRQSRPGDRAGSQGRIRCERVTLESPSPTLSRKRERVSASAQAC